MPINTVINTASSNAIKDAFERIVTSQIPNERWFSIRNHYKIDTIKRIKSDNQVKLTSRKNQMGEYIAASVISHCSDGWTYLSRAIESLINGDIASTIHFAYYAELRSAMSLMAHEGFGIFDKKHVQFNSSKIPTYYNTLGGTHPVAYSSMKEWANLPNKKDVLFKLIKINNRSLEDWVRETSFPMHSAYTTSAVKDWIKEWSVDLELEKDKNLRNEMSYRPHFEIPDIDIQNIISKLSKIWSVLEPTSTSRFPSLDRYLLRLSLEDIYRRSTSKKPVGRKFETFIKNVFGRLGEPTTQNLFGFLIRATEPDDHMIFKEAKKDRRDININRQDPLPIICRSILLLRLSTGVVNELISNSSLNVNNLRFWWEKKLLHQGSTASIPSGLDAVDLYADIRESLDEISLKPAGSFGCIKDAFINSSNSLFYLKQFERPAIWGMGL